MITLCKNGTLWKGKAMIAQISIHDYFLSSIKLEKGFTLRSFFELMKYLESYFHLFPFSKEFTKEALKIKKRPTPNDMVLVFEKVYRIEKERDQKDHRINSSIEFFGQSPDGTTYALDLVFEDIIDHELVLSSQKIQNRKSMKLLPEITLLEFLYYVIWELSYWGTPDEIKKRREHLKKVVKEIEKEHGKKKTVRVV